MSACPHPLYTRSRHPLYTRPYRTIQKIPYRIPDEYHTKKYRTTYQKNIVSHSRRYRNPAMQCSTKNTVPHTIPYHAIPYRTIPYPYPAIPYCTHPLPHHTIPVGAPTHNSTKSTGHSTQVRSSTWLLLLGKREASAAEPVAGDSDVGRRVRPRWTPFLWLIDFLTQRHRIEPGGGRRVRGGGEAKE